MKVSARARLWLLPILGLFFAGMMGLMFLTPAVKCFVDAALGVLATFATAMMALSSHAGSVTRRRLVVGFLEMGTALACGSATLLLMGSTWNAPRDHRPFGAVAILGSACLMLILITLRSMLAELNSGA